MKQTAVEWLIEQMTQRDFIAIPKPEWIQQAKAMEKEQIKDAYRIGYINYLPTTNSEEYYNQTFKSE